MGNCDGGPVEYEVVESRERFEEVGKKFGEIRREVSEIEESRKHEISMQQPGNTDSNVLGWS